MSYIEYLLDARKHRRGLWLNLREKGRRWVCLHDGVYSLCSEEEYMMVTERFREQRARDIRASWDEKTELERRSGAGSVAVTLLTPIRINDTGPRESGEFADRQYHGEMWIYGEW